jgi:hypothetical protein
MWSSLLRQIDNGRPSAREGTPHKDHAASQQHIPEQLAAMQTIGHPLSLSFHAARPNRVIISFTSVRMLADCVGASKCGNISTALGIALKPIRRLYRMVASSQRICQTQSSSLRIYVKEFMTGFGTPSFREVST